MSKMPTTPTSQSYARSPSSGFQNSRRGANAWHEVLDICKQGFASKMESMSEEIIRDIRNEVTDAVSAFRREATSSTVAADRPIGTQLMRVEDKIQKIDQMVASLPAPPDLSPVHSDIREVEQSCLNASKQLGDRLEQISRMNDKLSDRIQYSESNLSSFLERLQEKMERLEDRVNRSESKVGGDVSKVHQSLHGATSQIVNEVQKMQQQDEQHFEALNNTCADAGVQVKKGLDQLQQMSGQIKEQIDVSGGNVAQLLQRIETVVKHSETKLGDTQNMQHDLKKAIADEVQRMQKQDDRHYTDFGLYLETTMSDQRLQLQDIHESVVNFNFDTIMSDMMKSRMQQSIEFRTMLGELAKVQQALHVDYIRLSAPRGAGNPEEQALMLQEMGSAASSQKRVREFFTQTVTAMRKESHAQTDPISFEDKDKEKKKRKASHKKPAEPDKVKKQAFAGADKLKQAAKEASMKPPYNVFDYYHERGICQMVAKSNWLENLSLAMVVFNAIWIAVDTDLNTSGTMLVNSPLIFQIMENVFCTYFSAELAVRFGAFQRKGNAFRDAWFAFDFGLVVMMVVETWVVTVVIMALDIQIDAAGGSLSLLRMIKMVKLIRLSRMARLLRSVPELVIIVKGLRFASRSVTVFFLLWGMIVYIFAVLFRQLTAGFEVGTRFFPSVPDAMNTLLLQGVFAESAPMITQMTSSEYGEWWMWPLLVGFFALVSLTLMYMLVGVLVDVVGVVATSEKEGMAVSHIASQMREELQKLGYKEDADITLHDFQNIFVEAGVVKIVQEVGVDVVVLADMLDLTFEQFAKGSPSIRFPDLIDAVLGMRGTNHATVKDCKEQIRVTKTIIKDCFEEVLKEIRAELSKVQGDFRNNEVSSDSELE
mmetsp:Transcript_22700/g.41107  ORF Transcript_22700/g.41107 Transcript_22700/m.41107 type:complete len:880 (-) Transcript_22700:42-2681(-)